MRFVVFSLWAASYRQLSGDAEKRGSKRRLVRDKMACLSPLLLCSLARASSLRSLSRAHLVYIFYCCFYICVRRVFFQSLLYIILFGGKTCINKEKMIMISKKIAWRLNRVEVATLLLLFPRANQLLTGLNISKTAHNSLW